MTDGLDLPAASFEALFAEAAALTPQSPVPVIQEVLCHLAATGLHPIDMKHMLFQLKRRTRLPLCVLGREFVRQRQRHIASWYRRRYDRGSE